MRARMMLTVAAALLPLAAAASPPPSSTVSLAQGQLSGVTQGASTAFLGIPYAAAPVGPNRWRRPQPAPSWKGVRPATKVGASCAQDLWQPFGPYTQEFLEAGPTSEDCLFLNVWTPTSTTGKWPVLVWIHGGGFAGGSGGMPMMNGAPLASKGAVVVTINYRLGIFGYLAHPGLTAEDPRHTSGNYGLEDQIAAVRWVRNNIARFGGDPEDVTIGGESGGAVSVNSLLLSPEARGLFQRAVAVSGTGMGIPAPKLHQAEEYGLAVAKALRAKSVADLRALSTDRVLAGVIEPAEGPAGAPRFAFWPVVDGTILPEDPNDRSSHPRSIVPLMAGFNADENSVVVATTIADFEKYVRAWFGDHADKIMALYPHATDEEAVASVHLLARDRYMTSLILWTSARTKGSGQRIYRYLYDHPSPTASGPSFGAFHTAGVPYIFGNLDPAARPYGPKDREVSEQLQGYLVNFMKHGDPNGGGLPAWPKTLPTGLAVMALGLQPGERTAVSNSARFEALRAFAADGGVLCLF